MGAQNVLFAKCTMELLEEMVVSKSGAMWLHFGTYAIIAAMCTTIFLQVRWLNEALERFVFL